MTISVEATISVEVANSVDQPVSESVADVAERLMAEFDGVVPLPLVTSIVLQVRRELIGVVPAHAVAATLYRQVRRRIGQLTDRHG